LAGAAVFGKQRTMAPQQTQPAPVTTPVTAPAPAGNRWLGPLAGLAIGAGLGALFAGGGLGGAMGKRLAGTACRRRGDVPHF